MGAGNKFDAARFEEADLFETSVCPIAKRMRKQLKSMGVGKLRVIYSKEKPRKKNNLFEKTKKIYIFLIDKAPNLF